MTTRGKRLLPILEKELGPVNFAMFVRVARTTLDLTQVQMAKKLGIAPGTLCDLEKGRQSVSVKFAVKIAKAAGLPIEPAVEKCLQDQLEKAGIKKQVKLA